MHPEPDRYDFEPADRYVDFGTKHGMFVVGHVLALAPADAGVGVRRRGRKEAGPRDGARAAEGHIDAVVGRYRGRIGGWDVVNEALDEDGTLRKTPWLEAIGEDYVAKAFEYAHAADPGAELYYNDYNLWKPAKRDAAVRLVQGLKAKGLRVDGIGEQAHWGLEDPPLGAIDACLAAIARLRYDAADHRARHGRPAARSRHVGRRPLEEGEDQRQDEHLPGRAARPRCRRSWRAATRTCSRCS